MNKTKALNIISVISMLELLVSVAWPAYIIGTRNVGLGIFGIGAIAAILVIYYLIFIVFVSRYSKREPEKQNIGLVVLLNMLPFIFMGFLYLFG
ncbi:hypothetical protein [Mucilaginibacter sp. FT3.2]|uniref:hypothetical protein n=1 Tax=Mucilaginibacter sp. FT3.2 TaxID=2723090 RepID=UPI00161CBC99|nr:hypothetical protein [Mucilaginibacter sp. FT3.2]MBB6231747.1 putative membrane protein [Mucilaginibacter sp. FT3.2]